jgi:hypothetical protein
MVQQAQHAETKERERKKRAKLRPDKNIQEGSVPKARHSNRQMWRTYDR